MTTTSTPAFPAPREGIPDDLTPPAAERLRDGWTREAQRLEKHTRILSEDAKALRTRIAWLDHYLASPDN